MAPRALAGGADLESSGLFSRIRRSLSGIRLVVLAYEILGDVRRRGGVNGNAGILQATRVEDVRDATFGAILIEELDDLVGNSFGLFFFTLDGIVLRIL